VIYGLVLIFIALYIPFFNKILGTVPLRPLHWLLVLGVGLLTTAVVEGVKLVQKKYDTIN
jgi:hypothetical protein